jgi:restriction endonuclease S subunit
LGKRLLKRITVEGTRSRFSLGELKKLIIGVPKIEKQIVFVKNIETLMKSKFLISNNKSDNLFNTLIQKAFNGELAA